MNSKLCCLLICAIVSQLWIYFWDNSRIKGINFICQQKSAYSNIDDNKLKNLQHPTVHVYVLHVHTAQCTPLQAEADPNEIEWQTESKLIKEL
jgi:hypothetical protein